MIELDEQMIRDVFLSGKEPDRPWFVAFIRKRRSQPEFWQSAFLMTNMKVLADEYGGKVQFAIIDASANQHIEKSFGGTHVPMTLMYKDGKWHMQQFMHILVNNVRTFIEGRYLEKKYCYDSFDTPWLLPR